MPIQVSEPVDLEPPLSYADGIEYTEVAHAPTRIAPMLLENGKC